MEHNLKFKISAKFIKGNIKIFLLFLLSMCQLTGCSLLNFWETDDPKAPFEVTNEPLSTINDQDSKRRPLAATEQHYVCLNKTTGQFLEANIFDINSYESDVVARNKLLNSLHDYCLEMQNKDRNSIMLSGCSIFPRVKEDNEYTTQAAYQQTDIGKGSIRVLNSNTSSVLYISELHSNNLTVAEQAFCLGTIVNTYQDR